MANVKITALAAAAAVAAGSLFVAVDPTGTVTEKATGAQVAAFVISSDPEIAALAGLASAANKVPYYTGPGTAALADFTAAGRALVGAATPADQRTALGITSESQDPELTALAGLTSEADRVPYFTGLGTADLATFTAAGRALVGGADAAAQRATLGLVIGTNVQAQNAGLAAIAGLTTAADRLPYFTGAGTAALATFTSFGRSLVDDVDATAARTTLGLGSIATQAASAVAITGGAIDGAIIGAGSQAFGYFTGIQTTPDLNLVGLTVGRHSSGYPGAIVDTDTNATSFEIRVDADPKMILRTGMAQFYFPVGFNLVTPTSSAHTDSFAAAVTTVTADTALTAAHHTVINNKSGSALVLTLPAAATCPGRVYLIVSEQAQATNSASSNVVPKAGGAAGTAIAANTSGAWALIQSIGSNWKIIASGT